MFALHPVLIIELSGHLHSLDGESFWSMVKHLGWIDRKWLAEVYGRDSDVLDGQSQGRELQPAFPP